MRTGAGKFGPGDVKTALNSPIPEDADGAEADTVTQCPDAAGSTSATGVGAEDEAVTEPAAAVVAVEARPDGPRFGRLAPVTPVDLGVAGVRFDRGILEPIVEGTQVAK